MPQVGDLVANLVTDTSKWKSGLDTAQSQLDKFASTMTGSITGLAAGFAGIATADSALRFGLDAIKEAEGDATAIAKLEAVLQATGGTAGVSSEEVQRLAKSLELTNAVADDVTISAAGMLATFKNISGENFKQTIRLAHDLAAVKEIPLTSAIEVLGKALDDPIEGMTKLKRAGIILSDEQKDLIKSLTEAGNAAAAQAVILRDLEGRVGGAAAATANATQKIAVAWGNIKEAVGGELLGSVELVAKGVTKAQQDMASESESVASRMVRANLRMAEQFARQVFPILLLTKAATGLNEALSPQPEKLKDIAEEMEVVFAEGHGGEEIQGWDAVVKNIKKLEDELAILSGAATQSGVELRDMLKAADEAGMGDAFKERLRGLHQEIESQKELAEIGRQKSDEEEKLNDRATQIRESLMTPEQKFEQYKKELESLRDAGKLTDEELSAALKKERDKLGKTEKDNGGVAAVTKGSAEASSAIFSAMREKDNIQQKQLAAQEQLVALNERAVDALEKSGANAVELVAGSLA